ncbi:FAD-binding oxidoreductase [Paenarthrobacter sp. TYUT067]|uniref:FAD-binding oxidoreductase n=1 Tax=Micrococcaceae TaxID=1268 RepID=UPI001CC7F7A1|nr:MULTISPECIES: FAD-binding oxidoreductase [Micrococcaceae]MCM0616757.1 FAD-binding oxidoreductase [Paenarthrobacter sp. TYUT067]BCW61194.1 FAD-linked oxidase [Arthrobacter sp. StoSoilB22]
MQSHASFSDVSELQLSVHGPVFTPADPGFAPEVAAFNLSTQHQPDLAFGALDAEDVSAAVRWAAERGMPVSVQSTGHGATNAIEGGLLISTRRMLELSIDPIEKTARVGAGVRWKAVVDLAATFGLMGLCGSTTDVGVVGYTLGGGLPILGRKYGFASDHVIAFELVTADGTQRRVTKDENPELFYLLRGGKGNLGIVTAMEFHLFPADDLYAGGLYFDGGHAPEVLRAFREWVPSLPVEASASMAFLRLPEMEMIPEPLRGKFVIHLRYAYQGDPATASEVLEPMRTCAPFMMDATGPLSPTQFDTIHQDPDQPVPVREHGFLLDRLDEQTEDALLRHFGPGVDSPVLLAELRLLGGALAKSADGEDIVGGRDAAFSFFMGAIAVPPVLDILPTVFNSVHEDLRPAANAGTFVNLHGHFVDAEDRERPWLPGARERLRKAKAELDPKNMFSFGHVVGLPVIDQTVLLQDVVSTGGDAVLNS